MKPSLSLVLATDLLMPLTELAGRAERAGLHRLWLTEFQGRDALVRSTVAALSSERLHVGTGIAYGFTRLPLALAAAALDVQEISGGRFTLGLGAGTRGLRRAFGANFEPPVTRLSEVIGKLREAWSRAEWTRSVPPPPLAVAGVNQVMLRRAAELGDRVLLHPLCLVEEHLRGRVLPALVAGSDRRTDGRRVSVAAWCIASVDADGDLAFARARRQLTFYLSTPGYRDVVAGTRWEAPIAALREQFAAERARPDWERLSALVPDELVDQIAVTGRPEDVVTALRRKRDLLSECGVDEIVLQTTDAAEHTLAAAYQLIDTAGRAVMPDAV